jgi:thiamine-phosphate diphosphorylase
LTSSGRRLPSRLLALTPGVLRPGDGEARALLLDKVEQAVEGGLTAVLVREPALYDAEVFELLSQVRARTGDRLWLGVHDRIHLAVGGDVDGVQLGWSSLPPARAREVLDGAGGVQVSIGFSAHVGDEEGQRSGADFFLLAPLFPTKSHPDPERPDHRPPLGARGFAGELSEVEFPTWALGGVDPSNAHLALEAGAAGIAVRGAILGRPSPAEARASAAAMLRAIEGASG